MRQVTCTYRHAHVYIIIIIIFHWYYTDIQHSYIPLLFTVARYFHSCTMEIPAAANLINYTDIVVPNVS